MAIEPGTSPKHRYELIKATLLVIVGVFITITIVYGLPFFSPEKESPIEESIIAPSVENIPVISPDSEETTTSEVPDTIYQDAKSIMPE